MRGAGRAVPHIGSARNNTIAWSRYDCCISGNISDAASARCRFGRGGSCFFLHMHNTLVPDFMSPIIKRLGAETARVLRKEYRQLNRPEPSTSSCKNIHNHMARVVERPIVSCDQEPIWCVNSTISHLSLESFFLLRDPLFRGVPPTFVKSKSFPRFRFSFECVTSEHNLRGSMNCASCLPLLRRSAGRKEYCRDVFGALQVLFRCREGTKMHEGDSSK